MFDRIVREGGSQRDRHRTHGGFAILKSPCDRLRQQTTIEFKLPRQEPKIEEVLQTAVELPELDHCLELLGDHGLLRVRAESGLGVVQNGRVVGERGIGHNRVTETNVDLHGNMRIFQGRLKGDSHTQVVRFFLNQLPCHGLDSKHQSIRFDRELSDIAEHLNEGVHAVVEATKQVNVACRTR